MTAHGTSGLESINDSRICRAGRAEARPQKRALGPDEAERARSDLHNEQTHMHPKEDQTEDILQTTTD